MDRAAIKGFNKLCLSTLVAVYFLILVGAIVRSTGSGMGCPDWPKCFGMWIPPTCSEDLPANYKESYTAIRLKKNVKFISMLKTFGMKETAARLESSETILLEEEFSPLKSKIEYLNRVVGVVIGFMISLVLYRSLKFIKSDRLIFVAALIAWVSVVFTGWFGSIVVSTNLTPWTVSVHLGFAILIVGLLVYLFYATSSAEYTQYKDYKWIMIICLVVLAVQMVLGIQVREALDQIAFNNAGTRDTWISALGIEFIIHRTFSWIVLLVNGWLCYKLMKISGFSWLAGSLGGLTLGSILTGVGMAYGSVPPFLQPLHLLISTITFGIVLLILFRATSKETRASYA